MALSRSRADAIALFLSGAVGAGGVQADPDLSLGGYRSSSRCCGLTPALATILPGVLIEFASGANGIGTGMLSASDVGSLAWCPPGADAGGSVIAIANGETKLLEGADPTQFLVVTRTSADDLSGGAAVELVEAFNDVLGQADASLPSATPTYRAVFFKNGPTQTVRNLKVWIGEATDVVQIALEQPASQPDGAVQSIANETTAPTGLSFVTPTSAVHVDVLTVATLKPNEQVAVWIKRNLGAAAAAARARLGLDWSYTVVG
jgi:hypothetical protein